MDPPSVGNKAASSGIRRGAWSKEEDSLLRKCVEMYGEGNWHLVPHRAGLKRCRKGCRLRWLNYLSPNIKRGRFSADEEDLIFRMHRLLGNRWSLIARRIPGRTANDVKNHWNSCLAKRVSAKPAATELPAAPAARTIVYKPQAHKVSMRMRELLRETFSPRNQPSLNPPSTSQPPDATAKMTEMSTSNVPMDVTAKMAEASISNLPLDQLLEIAPDPSSFNLPWLPGEDATAKMAEASTSNLPLDQLLEIAPDPSSFNLPWLPGTEELAPGGGDWFLDTELDDLFCDSLLWDWTKADSGSYPLR